MSSLSRGAAQPVHLVLEDALDELLILHQVLAHAQDTATHRLLGAQQDAHTSTNKQIYIKPGKTKRVNPQEDIENLNKIQRHREYVEEIVRALMEELQDSDPPSFYSLLKAVSEGTHDVHLLHRTLTKESESRERMKSLQDAISAEEAQRRELIDTRSLTIAHLKDQLHEVTVRSQMEGSYLGRSCQLQVADAERKVEIDEGELRQALDEETLRMDDETRVNTELETYLRAQHQKLENDIDAWHRKLETDMELKDAEKQQMIWNREQDAGKYAQLMDKYRMYQDVIKQDQNQRDSAIKRRENLGKQNAAAIKIQAWWRGEMVRKQLGQYNPAKRKGKKGKKGAKAGKGKANKKGKKK